MKYLIKNKNWEIDKDYNLDKILYLLIDRPDYIISNNCFIWENNKGQFHRNYDLPAYVCNDGHIEWCNSYKSHRENNKPAVILPDGIKEYFINNILLKKRKIK